MGNFIVHNLYHENSPKGPKYSLEAIINELTLSSMTCLTYKMSCSNKIPYFYSIFFPNVFKLLNLELFLSNVCS